MPDPGPRCGPGVVTAERRRSGRQRPLLVRAVVAGPDDELRAVGPAEPRVVQAQVPEDQHVRAAGVYPPLVRAAVAGEQDDLGPAVAERLVVDALAVHLQLTVGGEGKALRGGSVAVPDVDLVTVGGAVAEVVDALGREAPDRAAGRRWRRGGRRGRRR